MTIFINIFGGPGIGKSTTAAGVFYTLKLERMNAELVPEFAKDLVWEGRIETLDNQVYVTGRQYHMIKKLENKADIVITDSPVMLGCVYAKDMPSCYHKTLKWCHDHSSTDGHNFVLRRKKAFIQNGRVHNEEESRNLDKEILNVLAFHGVPVTMVPTDNPVDFIVKTIKETLNK